jgi:Fe-S-cluster containining protein
MAPKARQIDRSLQRIYERLPHLACKGLCTDSCGPIEMSTRERVRIEQKAGRAVEYVPASGACSMLDAHGRCSVYELRPMICRLWGMTEAMRCPHGCVPEGGFVDQRRAKALYDEVDRVGGVPPQRQQRLRREWQRAEGR